MKWFKEKEFACRCCGELPPLARANVRALVEQVLDPVREKLTTSTSVATRQSSSELGSALAAPSVGGAIQVNSGYRCREHNLAVGGVKGSQHLVGEAADIAPAGFKVQDSSFKSALKDLADAIKENGRFDQMIVYPGFVHVSYKRNGQNRKQVLRSLGNGRYLNTNCH